MNDPPRRVALFATCIADRFFAEACADAVRVLEHFDLDVSVPAGQTCCGQPAYNTGQRKEAARMARHTARVFSGGDPIVLPSGSCTGMIRSFYGALLNGEPGDGTTLPERVSELSEFLVRELRVLGEDWTPGSDTSIRLGSGLEGMRVSVHHGCHGLRELGVREEPLALLRACGAEVVPWDGDDECCGFGGVFSTKFPEVSAGMADRKLDALPQNVDVVTSGDGGCLLQLVGRARKRTERRMTDPSTANQAGTTAGPRFLHLAALLRQGLTA